MVEHLLQASPPSTAGVDLLCDALREIAENWPKGRPLRILELGAIGGAATRRALDCLAQSEVRSHLCGDKCGGRTGRAAVVSGGVVPGVSARQWSPQDGDEPAGRRHVRHRTGGQRLRPSAARCRKLDGSAGFMAPGGFFLRSEPEPNALWDMVFGQSPGWWQSDSRAIDGSPLRSAEEWRAELAAAGFRSADAAPSASAPWPCAVFSGTAPPPPEQRSSRADPGRARFSCRPAPPLSRPR